MSALSWDFELPEVLEAGSACFILGEGANGLFANGFLNLVLLGVGWEYVGAHSHVL